MRDGGHDLRVRPRRDAPPGEPRLWVTPATAGWRYVSFGLWRLEAAGGLAGETGGEEVALVVLEGIVDVTTSAGCFEGVGGRANVFEGVPGCVYLPPGCRYEVRARTPAEVARAGAPAAGRLPARQVAPEAIWAEERGGGAARRTVKHVLDGEGQAERLLVVEVLTPAGNWSSYPPHRHERDDPPRETYLEETYYHRLQPAGGFALQRVYTEDRSLDVTLAVADGDLVLVPRGFHPVAAPPGYDLYYLNVMAGPVRAWHFYTDPAHGWVAEGWPRFGARRGS